MAEAPESKSSAYTRTLKRAAIVVGGIALLAEILGVEVRDLERWMTGEERGAHDVFLAALDIVAGAKHEKLVRRSKDAADRAQAAADRARAMAERIEALAKGRRAAQRPRKDETLRGMSDTERQPASNEPADKVKKKE